jgi:hypothetical protein
MGPEAKKAVLAHEALHAWQRQHWRWVTLQGIPLQAGYALGLCDPYRHDLSEDPREMLCSFMTGNIEQQGRIFERYVHASLTGGDTAAYRVTDHVEPPKNEHDRRRGAQKPGLDRLGGRGVSG